MGKTVMRERSLAFAREDMNEVMYLWEREIPRYRSGLRGMRNLNGQNRS